MKLREIRNEKGLTQQELSELSGVAREVIARAETGKTVPDLSTLIRLAKPLKCSLDELVGTETAS